MNFAALSVEIGFLIAVPLVVCVLVGVKIDRAFHTLPLFLLLSMALAATFSTIVIARKIKNIS